MTASFSQENTDEEQQSLAPLLLDSTSNIPVLNATVQFNLSLIIFNTSC